MKKKLIPAYIPRSFYDGYFQDTLDAEMEEPGNSCLARFEIYHQDDSHNTSKEFPTAVQLELYLVFIITAGEDWYQIGEKEYYLKPGNLCFVSPGLIASWQTTLAAHQGYFCAFSADFFQKGTFDQYVLTQLPFFHIDGSAILSLDREQTQYFSNLFAEIECEYHADNNFKADMLRAMLNMLFQKALKLVDNEKGNCIVDAGNAAQRIARDFIRLYQQDFTPIAVQQMTTLCSFAEYARKLFITQNHLSNCVKSVTGKTPGELVRERIVKEATILLNDTQLSISEIAYLLQFEDPSYFGRVYKKSTGMCPKELRSPDYVDI